MSQNETDPVLMWLIEKKAQAEEQHKKMIERGLPHVGSMVPHMFQSLIERRKEELVFGTR